MLGLWVCHRGRWGSLLLRPEDQRVVVDAASYAQTGLLILDANHLDLALELDIAPILVEALPWHGEHALKTGAQVD